MIIIQVWWQNIKLLKTLPNEQKIQEQLASNKQNVYLHKLKFTQYFKNNVTTASKKQFKIIMFNED